MRSLPYCYNKSLREGHTCASYSRHPVVLSANLGKCVLNSESYSEYTFLSCFSRKKLSDTDYDVTLCDNHVIRRLVVKPVCGGLRQVCRRSDLDFEELINLEFINKCSGTQDLRHVFSSLGAMLSGDGTA